jgi:hypothetical protein
MHITLADINKIYFCRGRYCRIGLRRFCAEHGIDWDRFMSQGIDSSVLLATGDAMALRLVNEIKRMRGN